jgi:hypothetical protein
MPAKTETWWSGEDLRKKPGGKSAQLKEAVAALKQKFEAGEGEIQPDGSMLIPYAGTAIRMQRMRSGVQQPICFFGEDLVEAGLIALRDREELKAIRLAKKELRPGGEALKRTGRSRTVSDD